MFAGLTDLPHKRPEWLKHKKVSQAILRAPDGRLLTLTLNRPTKRNALSTALIHELQDALRSAATDERIGALILSGRDPAFCAGLVLDEVQTAAEDPRRGEQIAGSLYDTLDLIYRCPKPVIAAINGHAVAGGAGLMSVCDIVVASEFAQIGYPEIKRGLAAAVVTPYLLRHVGESRAKYLSLTGESVFAQQAKELGLVEEVVAPADLMTRAKHLANLLLSYSSEALRLTKQWINDAPFVDPAGMRQHACKLHAERRQHPDESPPE